MITTSVHAAAQQAGRYAQVNGLKLYYEIHGSGSPLVLIHGGGSTIYTTFGRILPDLAKHYQVIALEMQAHGHTADIDREMTFEQDADDVAALLRQLNVKKADIFGFSNGGTTALQVAIRHPALVNKLVLASALYKRSGMPPGFFEGMANATLEHMPASLQEAYRQINPDPKGLEAMFKRDVSRMVAFKDIPDAAVKSVQAPALVINGDKDAVLPEHGLELARALPKGELAVFPGIHGEYIGEIETPGKNSRLPGVVTELIIHFLKK